MTLKRFLFLGAASLALLDYKGLVARAEDNPTLTFYEAPDCVSSMDGQEFLLEEGQLTDGTYAFHRVPDAMTDSITDENIPYSLCSAAVNWWKSRFSLFDWKPPVKADFKTTDAFSFLTLFNPSTASGGPEGECKVAICTRAGTERSLGALKKAKAAALVCLTSPNPLNDTPIFSDEQWGQLMRYFRGSASATVPSVFAFAAVLAGISLF
ncbi:hypothetical protein Emed_002566 [Eimeria media]